MKITKLFGLALLALSISMISCTGEDGTDGINGIDGADGINGQDGADGQNGQDGADGEGFDEMTQYGFIIMNLQGTRPDGVALEDSSTFKFTPLGGEVFQEGFNTVTIQQLPDNTVYGFKMIRFISAPENIYNANAVIFYLSFANLGEGDEEFLNASMTLNDYAVIGEDNKFFVMNDYFESGGAGVSDFEFTDMAFDAGTNHLTFSYSFMVTDDQNDSGHELTVMGEVDVYLLEEIQ